jgi:hypothetical protein
LVGRGSRRHRWTCPGHSRQQAPADLAAGVQVANKATFFSFTTGRILALDY